MFWLGIAVWLIIYGLIGGQELDTIEQLGGYY